uniref:Uncharacterized protein n=1 Tax=Cryptococcus bacillisporus CA1280 TaxID=1296109 RepID=A0A0D0THH7_CRYGA|nr:hypothetical protein I312_04887 [Cryptococcus bacillisporus CA1280]
MALVACSVFFEHCWIIWLGSCCPGTGLLSGVSRREWVRTNPRIHLGEGRAFLTKEVGMTGRKGKRTVDKASKYSKKALANWVVNQRATVARVETEMPIYLIWVEICEAPVAEQQRSADEAHFGQRLFQMEEALSAKFIKREDADDNTYAPLQPSQATQRREEKARQRTARYKTWQRGENVPKFPRGTLANPDSFHCRMKSALRPWRRVDEDLRERIQAKRRQVLKAGRTWGDAEEEGVNKDLSYSD